MSRLTRKDLGFLITTSDASSQHFDRVLGELTRLGYPFAVNFDHCKRATVDRFGNHPLCVGFNWNNDKSNPFDETHKQYPLDILIKNGFRWAACLDTDEVFDRRAPEMIPKILESDADLVWCPRIDFWGDDRHYRVDGPMGPCMNPNAQGPDTDGQLFDAFYNLETGSWKYKHADVHAPYFTARDGSGRPCRRLRTNLYLLHYGFIDVELVKFKWEQWRRVYTSKLGVFRYDDWYRYLVEHPPELRDFDYNTWDGQ